MKKLLLILAVLVAIFMFKEEIVQYIETNFLQEETMTETGLITKKEVLPDSSANVQTVIHVNGKTFKVKKEKWDKLDINNRVTIRYNKKNEAIEVITLK